MVEHPPVRTGIDIIGEDCLSARVRVENSVLKILSVSRISGTEMTNALKTETGVVVLSVPDESVIFKIVSLPQNSTDNQEKVVQFELKCMLLEKPVEFCYDIIQTDQHARLLAVIARKEKLEQIWKSVYLAEENGIHPEGFLARSIALGRGFLNFCTNSIDRMVCLADFARDRVSLCFVLRKSIMAPASFDRSQFDLESEWDLSRIAAELKTIINFKLSELADRGINISLSKLIICGGKLTELKKLMIASRLMVPMEEPIFNRAMMDSSVIESELPLSDYLVSLGLTIE